MRQIELEIRWDGRIELGIKWDYEKKIARYQISRLPDLATIAAIAAATHSNVTMLAPL